VYLFFTKAVKEGNGKPGMKEDLTTRKGHAAPGFFVEGAILEAGFHDLLHRVIAYIRRGTFGLRTRWSIGRPKACFQGLPRRPGLRIGAPAAAERTALKKDHRADAGAIVETEFLNIKDKRFVRHDVFII
jgi:hypothetical protein